jgi:MFS family permease
MAPRSARAFYGWTVLSGLAIAQIAAWGVLYYGFAVFLLPMERELGWSRTQLSGAFSLGLLASAAAAMPIGRYIDRHGARGVMLLGSCAVVPLMVVWSQIHDLTTFYVLWIGLGVASAAVLYEPAFAIVVAWFETQRATALAALTSAGGLASTIFVPAITALVLRTGWRTTLLILAGTLAAVLIPIYSGIVRSRPSDLGLRPDGMTDNCTQNGRLILSALPANDDGSERAAAWMLAAAFAVSTLVASAAIVHTLPFLVGMGMSPQRAAGVMALLGAAQVPGRVGFAALTRWMRPSWLAPSVFALQALGLACLALSRYASPLVFLFAVLFGAGNGLTTLIRSTMVADRFGLARYGTVSGKVAACGQLARAAGPFLAAWAAAGFGRYEPVWWLLAATIALSILFLQRVDTVSHASPSLAEHRALQQ